MISFACIATARENPKVLRCGWYPWDPYQHIVFKNDLNHLTGLDVQLVRGIFERMGYEVHYERVAWKQHQMDVKQGTRDIAAGAFWNDERASYAYYSEPYRMETDVLYVRRGESAHFQFKNTDDLIQLFKQQSVRLGIVEEFYYGPKIMAYAKDSASGDRIVRVGNDISNFENLLANRIDALVIDRLAGATLAWRYGWQTRVEEIPRPVFSETIHVIFSKKSTTPELVNAFNASLNEMRRSGKYKQIVREYLLPVLLSATAGQRWFLTIDIIGTIAFAMSGVLLARRGGYSLFGAFVLASLPAVGGGIMRDAVVNRDRPAVLSTPAYLFAIIFTVTICYLLFKLNTLWKRRNEKDSNGNDTSDQLLLGRTNNNTAVAFFDGLGLSAFTVIGVIVAVETRCHPLWLWGPLLAALTGAGGGIVRDVIRADPDNPGLKGTFYAEVALIWGFIFSLFLTWYSNSMVYQPAHITLMVVTVMAGALITRMLVFRFKIRSPMY